MDHSPLWGFAERALEICGKFHLTSDEVGDLLGADPADLEIFYHEALKISLQPHQDRGFKFQNIQSASVWSLYIWKVDGNMEE